MTSELAAIGAGPAPIARVIANQQLLKAVAPVVKEHHVARIQGRDYIQVSGAQAIASALGYTSAVRDVRHVDASGDMAGYWEARAVILDSGGVEVGSGIGCVFDDEHPWNKRPQFARQMMAQTRATGRALKGVVGWAFAMLGASGSLAEEMPEGGEVEQPKALPARPAGPVEMTTVIADVQEKTSKSGKKYWRVLLEEGGGHWMTSFKPVSQAIKGRLCTLTLGTTAKGDQLIEEIYDAESPE